MGPKKPRARATPKIGVKKPTKPTSQSSTGHVNNTDYLASYRVKQTTNEKVKASADARQLQKKPKSNGLVAGTSCYGGGGATTCGGGTTKPIDIKGRFSEGRDRGKKAPRKTRKN